MGKFTAAERETVKSIVASLSIKKVPDVEIMNEINLKLKKSVSRVTLFNVRKNIKKDSYYWFKQLRDDNYSYIHEVKQRLDEILDLQKRHYEIVENNLTNPQIQQNSLIQLHKLTETLFHYFEVIPTYLIEVETKKEEPEKEKEEESETPGLPPVDDDGPPEPILTLGSDNEANQKQKEIVCYCEDGAIMCHYECAHCGNIWCPQDKEEKQLVCPNKDCMFTLPNPKPDSNHDGLPDAIVY